MSSSWPVAKEVRSLDGSGEWFEHGGVVRGIGVYDCQTKSFGFQCRCLLDDVPVVAVRFEAKVGTQGGVLW